MTLIKFHLTSK